MIRFLRTTRRARHAAAAASFLALVLFGSAALAADPPGGKGTSPEKSTGAAPDPMMDAMMKYATPGAEHAVLQPFVGRWKAGIKTWMAPGDPTVSEGATECSWVMGGRYLISKHTGEFGGMPFEGMEILGFDRRQGQYVSAWIDNMGTGIASSDGGVWDPAAKTLTIKMSLPDPVTGKPTPFRNVTKIVDENTHVFSILGTMNGQDYTQMEITYTRIQ